MALVTLSQAVAGTILTAAFLNNNNNAIINQVNGNIDATNLAAGCVNGSKMVNGSNFGIFTGEWDFSQITFKEQVVAPTTIASEVKAYSKDVSGSSELFIRKESNGPEVQMTDGGNVAGLIRQIKRSQDQAPHSFAVASAFLNDNSIPQNTQGAAYPDLDTTITAASTSNDLLIEVNVQGNANAGNGGSLTCALFRDAEANALAFGFLGHSDDTGNGSKETIFFSFSCTPADTIPHTYKVRVARGFGTSNALINEGPGGETHGGTHVSSLTIYEVVGGF